MIIQWWIFIVLFYVFFVDVKNIIGFLVKPFYYVYKISLNLSMF